jgi:hypothetical protein
VNDLGHTVERLELRAVDPTVVADEADRRALRAGHRARLIAHLPDHVDDARDLLFRRAMLHHDQHQSSSISNVDPSPARVTGPA